MSSEADHSVHVLNSLIETTLDSADGYRKAGEVAESLQFRTMFLDRASRRQELTARLQAEVRRNGGEPEADGTMLAKAHRTFLSLKDKVTGHSDKSVIEEVERGEDFIKAKFELAARDDRVTPLVRQVINEAAASIRVDNDEIAALKHSIA